MVSVPTCKRKPQQIEAHLLRKAALAVQMNDQTKMSCHCGNGIHFFEDFEIRNSHFATVPHSLKNCVFNEHGFQSAGMFLSVLVKHFSPWSMDSLDQVIESTGNLTKHSSKLEASKNFGEIRSSKYSTYFDMNLSSRVIQVWGSLESWAIPPWWNRSLLVSLLQDW